MSPERWKQVNELFHSAVEREPAHRAAFLDQACADDQELRREVESLIRSHEDTNSFIDAPAFEASTQLFAEEKPEFTAGQRIGHYKILSMLGRGGMGEVYLAQDNKLGRKVALKLLPASFTRDQERVRRFEQEARAASALNHPNILTIYDVDEVEGIRVIATEYIEGKTLREHIADKKLELSEALDLATQVASALSAAHQAGIVHRDIKPENIMLRPDGYLKVLDFGLAKLRERRADISDRVSQAFTAVKTNTGAVIGTTSYMSPEQAKGQHVEQQSDIFSFGVVLYEMLMGEIAFRRDSDVDTLHAIIHEEPVGLSRLRRMAPAPVEEVLRRCLAKEPDQRYPAGEDLVAALKVARVSSHSSGGPTVRLQDEIGSGEVIAEAAHNVGQQTKEVQKELQTAHSTLSVEFSNRKALFWTVGVLSGLLLIAAGAWYVSRLITKPGPTQLVLTAVPLTTDPGFEGMPSLSPDGSQVAFASGGPQTDNFDIYVKQIGGGPPRRLTSDPAVDEFPAWSPDGRSIAFIRDRGDKLEVLLIPSLGGSEREIAETVADNSTFIFSNTPPYLSWSADSKYLVTSDRASPEEPLSLFVLSVATGEKRRLTTPPAISLGDGNPAVSPDGRTLAFVRIISDGNPQLYVLPLSADCKSAGEERHLDLSQPSVIGPAWTADEQEIVCFAGQRWGAGRLWRVPLSGSERPQPLASVGPEDGQQTISRQGNRLVYAHWTADADIWRAEVSGRGRFSPHVKLIASTRNDSEPEYSPDGSRIVFGSDRSAHNEIWVCNGDGSNPVQVTSLESTSGSPSWFPDRRRIVFDSDKEGHTEIYATDITTLVPHRLTNDSSDNVTPSVSHDGKWIYFASRRTGRLEVWCMPADGGEAVQVTRKGGWRPRLSRDGKVVYYLAPDSADVWKVARGGGDETRVLGPVAEFAVASEGIYFIEIGTRL
jgi:eukaryotic-like serine/threonine-protein kinase